MRIVKEVCDYVIDMPIVEACEKAGITYNTFYKWVALDEELSEEYARARKAISYTVEHKLETIIAAVEGDQLKPDAARVMIDAEKWLAGKRNAPVYGDSKNLKHTDGEGKPLAVVVATDREKKLVDSLMEDTAKK